MKEWKRNIVIFMLPLLILLECCVLMDLDLMQSEGVKKIDVQAGSYTLEVINEQEVMRTIDNSVTRTAVVIGVFLGGLWVWYKRSDSWLGISFGVLAGAVAMFLLMKGVNLVFYRESTLSNSLNWFELSRLIMSAVVGAVVMLRCLLRNQKS